MPRAPGKGNEIPIHANQRTDHRPLQNRPKQAKTVFGGRYSVAERVEKVRSSRPSPNSRIRVAAVLTISVQQVFTSVGFRLSYYICAVSLTAYAVGARQWRAELPNYFFL